MIEKTCPTSMDLETNELWVFGYGSILWKTGFDYHSKEFGYIRGFDRRFWQGNAYHRGTPEKLGRVATLVKNPQGKVWGAAFHLVGPEMIKSALDHLGVRECDNGYDIIQTSFYSRNHTTKSNTTGKITITVLAFYATEDNNFYLGSAACRDIAVQVIQSQGHCGTNTEYVVRLAEYIRQYIPEDDDEHLFELYQEVQQLVQCEQ